MGVLVSSCTFAMDDRHATFYDSFDTTVVTSRLRYLPMEAGDGSSISMDYVVVT